MTNPTFQAIVLAAGRSSRFKTTATKLSFPLCGQPMIIYPIQALAHFSLPITVVVGYKKEVVQALLDAQHISGISYREQMQQKGTGHAVLITQDTWHADHVLIINGDMPLITSTILKELIDKHINSHATISFVTSHNTDTAVGYGRIVKSTDSIAIVEARDFKGNVHEHPYVNAGIYCVKRSFLEQALPKLETHSNSGEIYITDLVKAANDAHYIIETTVAPFDLVRGVNTLQELAVAESIKQQEIQNKLMAEGVRVIAPHTVLIDSNVHVGKDTVIGAGTQLRNGTRIGENCVIDAFCVLDNARIQNNSYVKPHSVISTPNARSSTHVNTFDYTQASTATLLCLMLMSIKLVKLGKSTYRK